MISQLDVLRTINADLPYIMLALLIEDEATAEEITRLQRALFGSTSTQGRTNHIPMPVPLFRLANSSGSRWIYRNQHTSHRAMGFIRIGPYFLTWTRRRGVVTPSVSKLPAMLTASTLTRPALPTLPPFSDRRARIIVKPSPSSLPAVR
jgi:hypothetical protein